MNSIRQENLVHPAIRAQMHVCALFRCQQEGSGATSQQTGTRQRACVQPNYIRIVSWNGKHLKARHTTLPSGEPAKAARDQAVILQVQGHCCNWPENKAVAVLQT